MILKRNISISENGFLFDATTGDSYSVNESAADMLNLLKEGRDESEIRSSFLERYEVDPITFERNFYEFTSLLRHLGLINDN